MTKKRVTELTKKIIEYSKENTAGSLLTEDGIKAVLSKCDKKTDSKLFIEARIDENQSDSGYLVKVADFLDVLKPEKPKYTEIPDTPKKKEPKLHRKEFFQFVDHEFTQTELVKLSKKLSRNIIEIFEIKDRRDSAMSQFKSETAVLVAENGELTHKINSGSEERNVKCEALYFYDNNEKHIVRMDTGQVLFAGPIPDHERQIESFDKKLDKELELDDKAHEELLQNDTPEEQIQDAGPDTPETGQSSSEGVETEVMPGEHEVDPETIKTLDEQQAALDAEDAKIAEDIGRNLDTSKEESSIPPLPNE